MEYQKKLEIVKGLAKYRGDQLAVLKVQIEELEKDLPLRLEHREKLEKEIYTLTIKHEELTTEVTALDKNYQSLSEEKSDLIKDCNSLRTQHAQLIKAIEPLEQKRIELQSLVDEIKKQEIYLTDVNESVRIAEVTLKTLEVKINQITDREKAIIERESRAEEAEKSAKIDRGIAEKARTDTATINAEMVEHRRIIELSGKTIGHYARQIQKIFDDKGIKLDFLQLLQQIK